MEKWNSLTNPHRKLGVKYIVQKTLINTCFLHIRKVQSVTKNIYFAIGIKVLFLLLGAIGIANMWMAIFADVGVMILAVLNAIRALFVKNL